MRAMSARCPRAGATAPVGVASELLAKAGTAGGGAGGLPVVHEGQCVGAVGVSGASEAEDVAVAGEAIAAIGCTLEAYRAIYAEDLGYPVAGRSPSNGPDLVAATDESAQVG